MTIDELKLVISKAVSAKGCSSEFFFLLERAEGLEVKTAQIDEEDHNALTQIFVDYISTSVLLNDNISVIDLSTADDRVNAVYMYDLEEIPAQLTHLQDIIEKEAFDTFAFDTDSLNNLKGILVLIGNHEFQISLYKHQYPVTLLRKESGFSLIRSKKQHRFKRLDDDVLKVNSKFEFIFAGGSYFIFDLKALERFFGFQDAIKNIAQIGIDNIAAAGIIEDTAVLSDRLDDITFSRKLVQSAKNSPVLGVIPNDAIVTFTQTHPALKGHFKYSADGSKIKLSSKKSQNIFLKLLNDDFLQSELTKKYYESVAKDSVSIAE